MSDVIFYADHGPQIGLGHLSRCSVLAQRFQNAGAAVGFVVKDDASQQFIYERGFSIFHETPHHSGRLIVVDSYEWQEEDFRQHQKEAAFLLAIDDFADRNISCDGYLNHNLFATDLNLGKVAAKQFYLGFEYALISDDFHHIMQRDDGHLPHQQEICICFGGSDNGQFCLPVAEALIKLGINCPIKIMSQTPILRAQQNKSGMIFKEIVGAKLAAELTRHSILICGAGQTSLEAWYANINFLPTVLASNQHPNAAALDKLGVEVLYDFNPLRIAEKCIKMLNSKTRRKSHRTLRSGLGDVVQHCMN